MIDIYYLNISEINILNYENQFHKSEVKANEYQLLKVFSKYNKKLCVII